MLVRINQIVILFVALLLISCGISNPSESDARVEFEKIWKKELQDGTIKILSFKKVDGQAGEFAGVKFYTMEYEAEVEYPKGVNPECKNVKTFRWDCNPQFIIVKGVGEKEIKKGKANFEKTENGWQAK